jgi:hypothetical protein
MVRNLYYLIFVLRRSLYWIYMFFSIKKKCYMLKYTEKKMKKMKKWKR